MEQEEARKTGNPFRLELPEYDRMEEYLDEIIPIIRPWSEDLAESEYFLDKAWLEVRDDPEFNETVLHFFHEPAEYLCSVDGNVLKGQWRILAEGSNKLLLEHGSGGKVQKSELYDLVYLDENFFVLRKHGDQPKKHQPKYFLMGREEHIRGADWREVVDLLYAKYRRNNRFYRNITLLAIVLVVVIVLFSFC